MDDRYPGQYPEKLLRSLQRRVKHWRATQGPGKAVMFCQSVPAGHQGLSDFTRPRTAITIAGEPFDHLLYQFVWLIVIGVLFISSGAGKL
ncbi:MAG: hypothetical protein IPH22_13670 [Nitrosomonas sp.]|nr:hypothetical protein [Nitrosomonas sp.]